ncbi:MAG: class I SAM-dependent methyltransferase, partial [Psychrosphaera sp.]|nr:class I SAM-dependent methyltransferase [Psychrosphaera sp.]
MTLLAAEPKSTLEPTSTSELIQPDPAAIFAALALGDYDSQQMQRLFHGRGHTFPGLDFITVDWYPPALFICVFRPVEQSWLDTLVEQVWDRQQTWANAGQTENDVSQDQTKQDRQQSQVKALVLQRRQGADTVSAVVKGELPKPHVVKEKDRQIYVQLNHSQNVGVFPDMINGRDWVRAHSEQRNVLNLFSYTCLFSVAAMQGGASGVVNVDMNKSVTATGRKNHQLNDLDMGRVKFFSHNIFNSWGKIKRHGAYDLIIVDPPSFQKGSFVLTKDYQRLIKRLPELALDNADVMLCLNSPDVDCSFLLALVAEH